MFALKGTIPCLVLTDVHRKSAQKGYIPLRNVRDQARSTMLSSAATARHAARGSVASAFTAYCREWQSMDAPNATAKIDDDTAESDSVLVARVRAGEALAETEIVRRYARAVLTVAQQRMGHFENARDVAQETFIIVLERLRGPGIDDPERLSGFIRNTAVNLAVGEMRKQTRRRTDTGTDIIDLLVDENAGPICLLERHEIVALVQELIAELRVARDRQLLWKHYVLDEGKSELCREFGLNDDHFDRVIHRARHRLRELAEARHALP
jgi:RNA polymerase sigma factor (sigma-70 family)